MNSARLPYFCVLVYTQPRGRVYRHLVSDAYKRRETEHADARERVQYCTFECSVKSVGPAAHAQERSLSLPLPFPLFLEAPPPRTTS